MPEGTWSPDLLRRIINVHWAEGGGVFIAGDIDSNIYYLRLDKEETEPVWKNLGTLDFKKEEGDFRTGRVAGSAYAMVDVKDSVGAVIGKRPVFVLVGGSDFSGEIGIIMASHDGLEWSRVFTYGKEIDPEVFNAAGIFGVVWNDEAQMFYAGGHDTKVLSDVVANIFWTAETDILFKSDDGLSWSEVGRHEMRVDIVDGEVPPYPDYVTGLLEAHCRNLVMDDNGNRVPDGNYGYDEDGTLLISPTNVIKIDYLYGLYLNDIPQGSSGLTMTFTGEGDPPLYPLNAGIPVTCVATAGGKWVVAGGVFVSFEGGGSSMASILTSTDDGFVWKRNNPSGANQIITMCAGLIDQDAGL